MRRKVIHIDERKCNGCGNCVPGCPEGAIQIIDGKARLVSDLYCDGLGACIGTCPTGAITIEEREAEPYDESKVMKNIMEKGENTIRAHLKHLKEHGETELYREAVETLQAHGRSVPQIEEEGEEASADEQKTASAGGCPGALAQRFAAKTEETEQEEEDGSGREETSRLRQWPIKLRLLSPDAPYLDGADLLIAADCTAFACGGFHEKHLKGKVLTTFCPKLDRDVEEYVEKLSEIFARRKINSVSIVRMEVPCCSGTEKIVEAALEKAGVAMPVQRDIVSVRGEVKSSESLSMAQSQAQRATGV